MNLTPEQKQSVTSWVTSGDTLSTIQKKLSEQFQVSMTYMDVRFLVDDLNLALKDAAPKPDASDVTKSPVKAATSADKTPEKKGLIDRAKEKLGLGKTEADADVVDDSDTEFAEEENLTDEEFSPAGAGALSVEIDKVTLLPGAVASGSVTFSDGVTGKWMVDNYGRPGFTEVSKPGYRPSQADAQAFMQELNAALSRRGF